MNTVVLIDVMPIWFDRGRGNWVKSKKTIFFQFQLVSPTFHVKLRIPLSVGQPKKRIGVLRWLASWEILPLNARVFNFFKSIVSDLSNLLNSSILFQIQKLWEIYLKIPFLLRFLIQCHPYDSIFVKSKTETYTTLYARQMMGENLIC